MALREINSDAHADARVTTGRAAGPNRVRIFALWTGHGETAVPNGVPGTGPRMPTQHHADGHVTDTRTLLRRCIAA